MKGDNSDLNKENISPNNDPKKWKSISETSPCFYEDQGHSSPPWQLLVTIRWPKSTHWKWSHKSAPADAEPLWPKRTNWKLNRKSLPAENCRWRKASSCQRKFCHSGTTWDIGYLSELPGNSNRPIGGYKAMQRDMGESSALWFLYKPK